VLRDALDERLATLIASMMIAVRFIV